MKYFKKSILSFIFVLGDFCVGVYLIFFIDRGVWFYFLFALIIFIVIIITSIAVFIVSLNYELTEWECRKKYNL